MDYNFWIMPFCGIVVSAFVTFTFSQCCDAAYNWYEETSDNYWEKKYSK